MVKAKKKRAANQRDPRLPGEAKARALAVKARVDPRTVKKEILAPGSVRGDAGNRVREVLAAEAAS